MDQPTDPRGQLETVRGISLLGQGVEDAQAANPALSRWPSFSFLLISRLWLPPTPGTRRHCQRIWTGSRQHPALPCATRRTHVFGWHMTTGGAVGWDPGIRQGCSPVHLIPTYPGVNCPRSGISSVTSARFLLPSLSLPTCEMRPL